MAFSNLLQVLLIAENQSDKYQTHNDGIAALEQASNAIYKNNTAGNITVSKTNFLRYRVFKFSGAAAAQNLLFPSTTDTGSTVNTQREFVVWNASSFDYTVKASTGTGASYVLKTGRVGLFYLDFEDVVCMSDVAAAGGGNFIDIGLTIPGQPADAGTVLYFPAVRAFSLPTNLTGSRGACRINPTATATFAVTKNGSSIGSAAINTSGVFTFTLTATSFVAGDILRISAPTPQDASLVDVGLTLVGTLS